MTETWKKKKKKLRRLTPRSSFKDLPIYPPIYPSELDCSWQLCRRCHNWLFRLGKYCPSPADADAIRPIRLRRILVLLLVQLPLLPLRLGLGLPACGGMASTVALHADRLAGHRGTTPAGDAIAGDVHLALMALTPFVQREKTSAHDDDYAELSVVDLSLGSWWIPPCLPVLPFSASEPRPTGEFRPQSPVPVSVARNCSSEDCSLVSRDRTQGGDRQKLKTRLVVPAPLEY